MIETPIKYYDPSPNVTSSDVHRAINELIKDDIKQASVSGIYIVYYPTYVEL